ncbi:dipeptidase [Cellulophaga sp. F20128]|uniref:membrane dipeptidase n=1 Tax=Cellulophaga sp. F20128 TaxID=2926413 RepID=UPI001FF4757B|nr:membrane dipeptidase [Cellulophaga sp. F20128]MCK0155975.1 dipeptidase [Cellulophaga sp. F20128]
MSLKRNNYVDFHCHAAMKPYGKSYNYKTIGRNNPRRNRSSSIWKYNPPSIVDKLINYLIHLTKFSQANFTSLAKGGVSVVCVSLYPLEKWFFENKIKSEFIKDISANFATGVGKKRVDHIQGIKDYFKDLEMEYDFYKQLDDTIITLPEGKFKYKLVKNYEEIELIQYANQNSTLSTICVILSIEGMHVLNSNLPNPPRESEIIAKINTMKSWESPLFFVAIAHHFWNHLCGHAESFTKLVKKKVDQSEGINTGFTDLGIMVVHQLLSNANGRRIFIDIKHMSVASRKQYYDLLENTADYRNVPIIVSHGAANGHASVGNKTAEGSKVAKKLKTVDINFYDDEIIRIAKSKGIFGLQLDERRIASNTTIKNVKHATKRSKIMHYRAELLWYQIQHIAEMLDSNGLFIWDCLALGTDYDGIIDPLNGFWTAEELPFLADFLERHAYNYRATNSFNLPENNIDADEIVTRIMSTNGHQFLERFFR